MNLQRIHPPQHAVELSEVPRLLLLPMMIPLTVSFDAGWSTPTVDEAVLECLHEYGEVCLESDKLGQRLEVYLRKRDEYVVKRDSEVLVELATADEVYEYLLTLPQISTFKVV